MTFFTTQNSPFTSHPSLPMPRIIHRLPPYLAVGATFTIATGKADVSYLPSVREASQPLQFVAPLTLQAVVIPLQLRIAPVRAKQQTLLCD